ncbi:MAG: flavin-containing monooxygenase [Sporichthyaceae bacterium]
MTTQDLPTHTTVAIIGTGFSGLGTAIRLARSGRRDFVVLERADDLGGTWRDNTYPGAACDVPSRLYSFSFALNPNWSRSYSSQGEILAYLRACATEAGVLPHIRYRAELTGADWDAGAQHWRITTPRGTLTAAFLVLGTGALVEPARPDITGLDDFAGTVFHSARWNHDHDLTGRRIAVIGTGASAIQFIPQVQKKAAHVTVFQRTPPWVLPRPDRRVHGVEQWAYRNVPFAHRIARAGVYALMESRALGFVVNPALLAPAERIARANLGRAVKDPELREKLTPHYSIGCKRILISNDYYPALAAANVDVVTAGIDAILPEGIRDAAGTLHPCDTLILGTGFLVTNNPGFGRIRGRDGISLEQAWATTGMHAHLGTSVPGFPNMFLLLGPNTGIGHTSAVYMIESQIELVRQALAHAERHQVAALEIRPEVEAAYNSRVAKRSDKTVWTSGCASWYLDEAGRNTVLWPDLTFKFRALTRTFRPKDYASAPRRAHVAAQPGVSAPVG